MKQNVASRSPTCTIRFHCAGSGDDLLRLHEAFPERYPHYLASTAGKAGQSRFSILFAFPSDTLIDDAERGLLFNDVPTTGYFLEVFDQLWSKAGGSLGSEAPHPTTDDGVELPFTGGWFVYLSYEMASQVEPILRLPRAEYALPRAAATRFPAAIICDSQSGRIHLLGEDATLCDAIAEDWASTRDTIVCETSSPMISLEEEEEKTYLRAVDQCIEYIRAGDIFQANLSRLWRARITDCPHALLFRRLAHCNPAPFAALASWGKGAIISSSPERLISLRHGVLETRPIAGTHPRGDDNLSDMILSRELLAHPKERAEHIMLVDLERNDISRVSVPGSVKVNEMMTIESYAHVHHIVSNVRAHVRPTCRPGQILAAVFPGGTITGCPKVRCMEILAELEKVGRGPYTGTLGYVNHDSSMDMNILIRSMTRESDRVTFRAGGGIVADSKPKRELLETRHKARALVRSLTEANG